MVQKKADLPSICKGYYGKAKELSVDFRQKIIDCNKTQYNYVNNYARLGGSISAIKSTINRFAKVAIVPSTTLPRLGQREKSFWKKLLEKCDERSILITECFYVTMSIDWMQRRLV